jgi:putative ABC transport system permease protein
MVMKRNAMRKNVRRTILHSLGRYIAIVLIIALGAGIFVGLLTTKTDMVATAQRFTDETNMFHLRLINTYGWTAEQVANIHAMEGVKNAEGGIFLDVIGRQHNDTQEGVYRLHSIQESVNKVHLLGGRMPQSPEECLVDGAHVDDSVLGTQFHIADDNAPDTLESLNGQTFTVVGYVSTPLYMDMARGNTDLGSGSLTSYVYLPKEAFAVDYFTEIVVTMDCPHPVYSEELTNAMEDFANRLEPGVKIQAGLRFDAVKTQAMEEYNKGLQEYLDGLAEFEEVKNETNGTLSAALAELQKGQAELDSNALLLEDGRIELNNAQAELDNNAALLEQSRQELASAKSLAYAQIAAAYEELGANQILVASSLAQVLDGMKQIEAGIPQIEDGLAQIAEGLEQLNLAITLLDAQISILEELLVIQEKWPVLLPEYIQTINQELETGRQERAEYEAQR